MSELINNSRKRIDDLKALLLRIHEGISIEEIKEDLTQALGNIPYGEVVQAEQELISEGLPPEEIQKYCDLHSEALRENIDLTYMKNVPAGHPIDILREENKAIESEVTKIKNIFIKIKFSKKEINPETELLNIREIFNNLTDIEKHYSKKENLLFSYLERYDITGPSSVMWGKDDEVRSFIKSSKDVFNLVDKCDNETLHGYIEFVFKPTIDAIIEMKDKEEKILFPMCLDKFTEMDWYEIYYQFDEIGYCLYSPQTEWKTSVKSNLKNDKLSGDKIKLSTGSFTVEELEAIIGSIPVDLTFVDKDDKVRFFSHGGKRIFDRNKAILGREVQFCHPPSSVHIVDKILNDFKGGIQDSAKFWINLKDMYVHIAYYAVRNDKGGYLGTLEVTQDINQYKKIEGEKRLLSYEN